MTKYRIKKHENYYSTNFEVQKKVWFIPFWYNFNNIDGMTTGFYDTENEAKEAIKYDRFKGNVTILNQQDK